jgi:hypothetical protein
MVSSALVALLLHAGALRIGVVERAASAVLPLEPGVHFSLATLFVWLLTSLRWFASMAVSFQLERCILKDDARPDNKLQYRKMVSR